MAKAMAAQSSWKALGMWLSAWAAFGQVGLTTKAQQLNERSFCTRACKLTHQCVPRPQHELCSLSDPIHQQSTYLPKPRCHGSQSLLLRQCPCKGACAQGRSGPAPKASRSQHRALAAGCLRVSGPCPVMRHGARTCPLLCSLTGGRVGNEGGQRRAATACVACATPTCSSVQTWRASPSVPLQLTADAIAC